MSLLHLPAELVVQIVAHVAAAAEPGTLCCLAQTCRLLQEECEKHIYATIDLFSTSDLDAIIEAFERRPERVAFVETLNIVYHYHEGFDATLQDRMRLNVWLQNMKALKHWYIESPFDNCKWDCDGGDEWVENDMEEFRKALEASCAPVRNLQPNVGLSKLEKLVIHSHGVGTDFWDLGGFHCLFRHPTLRHIHASCFVLPPDLPELESCTGSTALTTLVFDECVLTPKSLGRILRTPKSLKHLTLGENVYNVRQPIDGTQILSLTPLEALEALSNVSHSLESLTHYDPRWRRRGTSMYQPQPLEGDGMRGFHRLKFMDFDPCSFLHQFIYSHMQAPPNLETLRIHHALVRLYDLHSEDMLDLFEELPQLEPYTYLKSLKTLELVQAASLETYMAQAEHICDSESVEERHAYAYKLYKHGINLKMYLEASWRLSLIPPYLHGEQKPEMICIYDAASVGFRRHIIDEAPPTLMNAVDLLLATAGYTTAHAEELMRQAVGLAAGISDDNEAQTNLVPTTEPPETEPPETQPPETDQLNDSDIIRLRNEVHRSIESVCSRMTAIDRINKPDRYADTEYDDEEYEEMEGWGFHLADDGDPDWEDEGPADWFDHDDITMASGDDVSSAAFGVPGQVGGLSSEEPLENHGAHSPLAVSEGSENSDLHTMAEGLGISEEDNIAAAGALYNSYLEGIAEGLVLTEEHSFTWTHPPWSLSHF